MLTTGWTGEPGQRRPLRSHKGTHGEGNGVSHPVTDDGRRPGTAAVQADPNSWKGPVSMSGPLKDHGVSMG